ncbi:MAG TPA: methylated-DNA--[protein]-cysteine S-methyltransferase [Polyangia bacterium]|jgi:methylated-DNA-[protein]-cysteine S-methyltransferase|nr:methylated-DNA--[protein]-cysteine S-methyltransferase [Polyangia bacterium]
MNKETFFTTLQSPVGRLTLAGEGDDLVGLYFDSDPVAARVQSGSARDDGRLRPALAQLRQYFAGERTEFELSLAPRGTAFQLSVWNALRRIPFGETASYGEIARSVGRPAASRAIGGANHRNPIAIIIPCHRVIGADGSMTGYGGGLDRKRVLLDLEARGTADANRAADPRRRADARA